MSVSYTHLPQTAPAHPVSVPEAEAYPRLNPASAVLRLRSGPVSYTHLDVYKRQPLWKDGRPNTTIAGVVFFVPQSTFLNDIVSQVHISDNSAAYAINSDGYTIADNTASTIMTQNIEEEAKSDSSLARLAAVSYTHLTPPYEHLAPVLQALTCDTCHWHLARSFSSLVQRLVMSGNPH